MNTTHAHVYKVRATQDESAALYALQLLDGHLVECGMFSHNDLVHLCVSSQVGCPIGCLHCATTHSSVRFVRNLTEPELADICSLLLQRASVLRMTPVLSFSGHGEPLLNWDAVRTVMQSFCPSRIPLCYVTTIGIRETVDDLLAVSPNLLAVYISLHGPTDDSRQCIVPPHPRVCNCAELREFARQCLSQSRRVVFNYVLTNHNTTDDCVAHMESFFNNTLRDSELRLLRLNDVPGSLLLPISEDESRRFFASVAAIMPHVRVRLTRSVGDTCGIACGQLRARARNDSAEEAV
jgi:23S rRNA (adenine2503-C2)-methyltransferase